MISSLAVARRITPLRCRLPCSSTNPFGSVNSNSVLKAIAVELPPYQNPALANRTTARARVHSTARAPSRLWRPRLNRCSAAGLSELALLEDDLEALGRVSRALRVQGRTMPLRGEAMEEVQPLRLVALVVVEDDRDALAVGFAVDHFLAPVVELLGRGEVALDEDAARLQHARAAVRPGILAVVVLHHLGFELDALDLVDAADGDAVDLHPEFVAQVEVAVGLRQPLQCVTRKLDCHVRFLPSLEKA